MKLLLIKFTIALLPFFFVADDNMSWKVKTSAITLKIKNAGLTVDGSFTGLEADIKFNPLKPEEGNIKASVSVKSINTGIEKRDNHLRKEEYFYADKYPRILLQSTKIEKTGPITYKGTFNLTMKGVTKQVIIPFTFMKLKDRTEFKGSFAVNQRDYGVGGSSMTMSDTANITIVITVTE